MLPPAGRRGPRKQVTQEMIEQRAEMHAVEAVKDLVEVIRRSQSVSTQEYYELFRDRIRSAFTIGHAAGVCDQYSDPSLAQRSGM